MKKLLLLGGSRYLIPVIESAHKLGIYVITCDYLPENSAHKYSDEYRNISIVDREKVLAMAKECRVDGVMSFACDPGVVTAAYVAEKMRLPFQCSFESASILQDKGLFRKFLEKNDFNCPNAKRYTDAEEPFKDIDLFNWPVIVKPVDSAGSKSVTKVDKIEELAEAIKIAIEGSQKGAFIIEDFLNFEGHHSSTDVFTINGEVKFITYSDQLFDAGANNPYTPAYIVWPTSMKLDYQKKLSEDIQRLMKLLGMKTGIYNIETCVSEGKPYIMEVSPRGGGCKIAEIQQYAYGVDLIENEIRASVGMPLNDIVQGEINECWCEMVIHAREGQQGVLKGISIRPDVNDRYVKLIDLSVKTGDYVKPFSGANMSLGDMFLKFDNTEEMEDMISRIDEWLFVELE